MKGKELLEQEIRAITRFRIHVSLYILVTGLLWLAWLVQGGTDIHPWPVYPTFGWGVLLLAHYLTAYGIYRSREKELQQEEN